MSGNRRQRRPALILFVAVGAAGCLALGWWQWTRFEAVGGTGQNLGYAFQWPLFAAFLVYAYRRFVQLEDAEPADRADVPDAPAELREIPADILPARPSIAEDEDPDDLESLQISQYNQYLAELSARETDRSTT
ncbi:MULTISPECIES: transcriptional regulator [unclassified Rhodococcus (in: high G+C Gram-positive bacteria)]|uniref:transcriptional regulator n=1 Tax=unclassified Rhodococcus (in: high G+C Gram-positive bacteria) TaxID=192944 RepID=UPI00163B4763|nr:MULTISPECIES: transcriptional regulator [unclassified Rhodococcus (in: high G+C Gram-positive bacteria)]MBC2638868.1 transcriptional regulator [Rhodococcus sp. 3A]MBC2896391.1 transcriptional regulator [Rhodococcus sp. 4CII]